MKDKMGNICCNGCRKILLSVPNQIPDEKISSKNRLYCIENDYFRIPRLVFRKKPSNEYTQDEKIIGERLFFCSYECLKVYLFNQKLLEEEDK